MSGNAGAAPAQACSSTSPFGRFFSAVFGCFLFFFCLGPVLNADGNDKAIRVNQSASFFFLRFVNTAGLVCAVRKCRGKARYPVRLEKLEGTRPCRRWRFLHSHACTCWIECGAGELNLLKKRGSQMV